MKSKFTLFLFLLLLAGTAHAQMDEKFYFPDKQWIPVADTIHTEDLFLMVDNDTIHALIVKPKQTAKASILFFHGNGGNVSKWLGHFRKLIDNGYQICMLDYRGYGKSTGTPTHLNIESDAQLLFNTLLNRDDFRGTPLIIYGASIGTQVAVHTARNNNNRIAALVVDGMMASFTDVALATSPKEYHEQIKSSLVSPYSVKEDFPHIRNIKVLFIHSPEDFIPIAQSKEVYETVTCKKRFWEYTGDHVMAPLLYPDTLLEYMDWLVIETALPQMRTTDKIRINEAMQISKEYGDKIFNGYNDASFAIILVTDSVEFLLYHNNPSEDFQLLEYDNLLETNIHYRKAQFNKHFLATFPAIDGVSCIVVGTPENTDKNSSEWVITLLHEHFHQFQASSPDYYQSVNDLDLSGGDETGMWMLNYPFPYESIAIRRQFEAYSKSLSEAINSKDNKAFNRKVKQYFLERNKFKEMLSEKDYRYFSFQVWQEGIARNTEYEFLKQMKEYTPTKEFAALDDYVPFQKVADELYNNEMELLTTQELSEYQRVCFYTIGFAEGILLDRLNLEWRKQYLKDKFFIENYWNKN